jgi:hypothetical protein
VQILSSGGSRNFSKGVGVPPLSFVFKGGEGDFGFYAVLAIFQPYYSD